MKKIDNICDYDEGYTRADASEIGWCSNCKCNKNCPYYKETKAKTKKRRRKNEKSKRKND